eukprot:SAG31_NODE_2840_length_5016_cov_15.783608_5_plen_117_part_00
MAELSAFWALIGNCGRYKSCTACVVGGRCAWCVEEAICTKDEPRKCEIGPENHVGKAGSLSSCEPHMKDGPSGQSEKGVDVEAGGRDRDRDQRQKTKRAKKRTSQGTTKAARNEEL